MESDLQLLTEKLLSETKNYGILEISMGQYETVCKTIVAFANKQGQQVYSPELLERYLKFLDDCVENGKICKEYRRFQQRVVRMLSSLAETGHIDFSRTKADSIKYPVPSEVIELTEEILNAQNISEKTKGDLRAPVRHIFWYAIKQNGTYEEIDDSLIMEFIIKEIPCSNSGSTGRTLRSVKFVTEYLKAHGNKKIRYDYTRLTLKNDHRRIIPAFGEEEICNIASSIDIETPLGKRNYAIILLAYCTGLRGIDILKMKLTDIDWRGQKIFVNQSKTQVPLIATLNGQTMNALADYVLDARPQCSVPEVFVTYKAPYRKLSYGLGNMIDDYCVKASVNKIPLRSFHSLRRSFETVMVSKGVPIETTSRMMGHKTIHEEKPYITHDKSKAAFVAMGFKDVPIRAGIYADQNGRDIR